MRKESMSNKQEKWGNEGKETSESLGKKNFWLAHEHSLSEPIKVP